MNDIVIALFGAAVIAAVMMIKPKSVKENFFGLPSRTYKRDVEYRYKEPKYESPMFSVPPTYQASLSPRFSNVGYGAYIRQNIPPNEDLAVPDYPLTYSGKISAENYTPPRREGFNSTSTVRSNQAAQRQAALSQFVDNTQSGVFEVPTCGGGLNDVNVQNAGSMGVEQPIVYDRLIYANKKSRLYGRGDPIRGDLPIAPIESDWFRPSVYPNIDLREGAMNVIGGADNSTSNELRALQSEYSGRTALAQKGISLAGPQADIIVTAFP